MKITIHGSTRALGEAANSVGVLVEVAKDLMMGFEMPRRPRRSQRRPEDGVSDFIIVAIAILTVITFNSHDGALAPVFMLGMILLFCSSLLEQLCAAACSSGAEKR